MWYSTEFGSNQVDLGAKFVHFGVNLVPKSTPLIGVSECPRIFNFVLGAFFPFDVLHFSRSRIAKFPDLIPKYLDQIPKFPDPIQVCEDICQTVARFEDFPTPPDLIPEIPDIIPKFPDPLHKFQDQIPKLTYWPLCG